MTRTAQRIRSPKVQKMEPLTTVESRQAALDRADVSLRIEDLERDPASAPIFEAWVRGEITEAESIARLAALG